MRRDPERILLEPIRAELFGIDRLEQHAESLATAGKASANTRGAPARWPAAIFGSER